MQRVELLHSVKIAELNPIGDAFASSAFSSIMQSQILNNVNTSAVGDLILPITTAATMSLTTPSTALSLSSIDPFYIRVGTLLDSTTLSINDSPAVLTSPLPITPVTTLTNTVITTSLVLDVVSTAVFPTSGSVLIGTEEIAYTGTTATTFTGLTRGFNSSVVTTHIPADSVSFVETVAVDTTAGYPISGTVIIDFETVTYTSVTATTFNGITRAVNSTPNSNHNIGAGVIRTDVLNVISTLGFKPNGTVLIGTEQITYTSITSTSFVNLTRGVNSTTATSHLSASAVTEVSSLAMTSPIMRTRIFQYDNEFTQLNSIEIWNGGLTLSGTTFSTSPSVLPQTISYVNLS